MTIRPQPPPFRLQPSGRGRFINQPYRNIGSESPSLLHVLSYKKCDVVHEGDTGNATEAHAILIFNNKSGISSAESAKAAITLVGAAEEGVQAEVSLYDRLFSNSHPDAGGKDFIEALNPESLKVVTAFVKPLLAQALPDQKFQFEQCGYFVAEQVDHLT